MRVGLLGCGNVGGALAEILLTRADDVAARTGIRLELVGHRRGPPGAAPAGRRPADLIGTDAAALVERADVDVVVEVIGGLHPAHELIEAALRNGKPVVTANKALLATAGAELAEVAAAAGVDLLYEAAVAGAIPVIRPLRESLAGEQIVRVMGIVNGTTNYILTRMEEEGAELRRRPPRGPGARVWPSATPRPTWRGTTPPPRRPSSPRSRSAAMSSTPTCTARASAPSARRTSPTPAGSGYSVKLLAIAELIDGGPEVSVRVHPAMVPKTHPLASVRGAFNAVFVEGAVSGELMLYGRGRRGRADRERHARRPGRRVAQPPRRRAGAGAQAHEHHRRSRRTTCARPSTSAWTWPTGPACWPPWPRSSATTTSPSAPWSRSAWPRRPG